LGCRTYFMCVGGAVVFCFSLRCRLAATSFNSRRVLVFVSCTSSGDDDANTVLLLVRCQVNPRGLWTRRHTCWTDHEAWSPRSSVVGSDRGEFNVAWSRRAIPSIYLWLATLVCRVVSFENMPCVSNMHRVRPRIREH